MSKALDIVTELSTAFTGFREEITDVISEIKSDIEATHAQIKTVIDRQDEQIRELSRLVAVIADTRAANRARPKTQVTATPAPTCGDTDNEDTSTPTPTASTKKAKGGRQSAFDKCVCELVSHVANIDIDDIINFRTNAEDGKYAKIRTPKQFVECVTVFANTIDDPTTRENIITWMRTWLAENTPAKKK